MKITNYTGLVGFLLALATLNTAVSAVGAENSPAISMADRLDRLTAILQQRQTEANGQMPDLVQPGGEDLRLAIGWRNGNNNRGWVNTSRAGWGNGTGNRGFVNVNPWRNSSWRNVAPWVNTWPNGGGFYNYHPGWVNGGAAWRNGGGAAWVNR
uniref:RSAM-associated Gly-rich repeat protein n=1 Tax=Cyanothece sp. (strain PCC 7425 / ATCC 29141) TaxID=395961 RepID=B8HSH4_CYAP4